MPTLNESQVWTVPAGIVRIKAWCFGKGGNGAYAQGDFGGGGGGSGGDIYGYLNVSEGDSFACDVGGQASIMAVDGTRLVANAGGDSESRYGADGGGTYYEGGWETIQATSGEKGQDGKQVDVESARGGHGGKGGGLGGGAGGTDDDPPMSPTSLCMGGGGQAVGGAPFSGTQGGAPGFPPRIEITCFTLGNG